MRRLLPIVAVLSLLGWGACVPSAASPTPTRSLSVTGTGVGMYPAFDPDVERYAATTTSATAGTLTVTATTSDPSGRVLVDGWPATGPTTLTGLGTGDEVSVVIDDAAGRTAYSVIYLPAGFPALTATVQGAGVQPGLVALTLNAFNFATPQPSFDTIVDRNGVPVWVDEASGSDLDLRRQPNGEVTVSRPTTVPGHTGTSLVTLDDRLEESTRRDVVAPLTNTDNHDSVRLADGSTILIGYEPNSGTGKTDATIQKLDAAGNETFRWTSAAYASETMTPANADYAHVNSVVSVEDDDVIVSFRHLSAIYRIATVAHDGYAQGEVIWKLGGRDSDFTFVDDPYPSGPCAQHTASLLPNGHLLVFDNGTDLFCVNPLDPAGPGIFRGQTRVTEYELDTSVTPHTAALVWSYVPAGKYSWFAGSARRIGNNTLIAWAADRNVLSTEVDDQGQKVWEMTTPTVVAPQQRYATYRAELIPAVPDAIAPTATQDDTENAGYVVGDTVTPTFGCTDRGGSNLQTCTASGLLGGALDTRTAGPHTWTVTAVDGEGNTTTSVRHYLVGNRLPDGLVRKAGADWWRGDGVHGSAADQTIHQRVRAGRTATSVWRIQNDGARIDDLRLVGPGSTAHFRVRYLVGDRDVTTAVASGTYRTSALSPGTWASLRVLVTPRRGTAPGRQRTVVLTAVSTTDSAAVDRVATSLTVRR